MVKFRCQTSFQTPPVCPTRSLPRLSAIFRRMKWQNQDFDPAAGPTGAEIINIPNCGVRSEVLPRSRTHTPPHPGQRRPIGGSEEAAQLFSTQRDNSSVVAPRRPHRVLLPPGRTRSVNTRLLSSPSFFGGRRTDPWAPTSATRPGTRAPKSVSSFPTTLVASSPRCPPAPPTHACRPSAYRSRTLPYFCSAHGQANCTAVAH